MAKKSTVLSVPELVIETPDIVLPSFRPYASYSRLDKYQRCGKAYELHYVKKVPGSKFSTATLAGSFYHATVEHHLEELKTTQAIDFFKKAVIEVMRGYGIVLEEDLLKELFLVASDEAEVLHRCSASYKGPDAIRTKDGKVASKPEMTTGYKQGMERLSLPGRKEEIDFLSAGLSEDFMTASLSSAFGLAYYLVKQFKLPNWFDSVQSIELEFSRQPEAGIIENLVEWPGLDLLFNGKIDLVCLDTNGEINIIDHKTSSGAAPTENYVAHHEQLNVYAWAYKTLFGIVAKYMGINHVKTDSWIRAEIDHDLSAHIVENLCQGALAGIKSQTFAKKNPTGYNSPCGFCTYLPICYPNFNLTKGY